MCIITGYIDGSCGTFAVLIVGAVVCFAVDVNGLTPTAGICGIFYSTLFLVTEAFTGGVVRITSICTFDTDGSPGAERIFVIAAVVCGAFKTCHKSVLLIIMILPETVSLPTMNSTQFGTKTPTSTVQKKDIQIPDFLKNR